MKEENAIEVHDITKTFKVYLDRSDDIKSFMLHSNRRRYEKRQVLKGISFEVKKGEAIGLVGHNGCGKSTTLKLLTRIMYPDSGSIEIKGRVSSLIELGAGFHPDMSGRENIYINASIFGLSKKEIDDRLDDIIAFSELEDFIDNPVRTYSSGMYMRLAFSVAINVDADVLLIDEILAVGDAAFQAKCFNKLREIKGQGTTIVIVSHSLGQIEQICERSYWIDEGVIREYGNPVEVHINYMEYMSNKMLSKQLTDNPYEKKTEAQINVENNKQAIEDTEEKTDKIVQIKKVYITDETGSEKRGLISGSSVIIHVEYSAKTEEIKDEIMIGILIFRNDGITAYGTNTRNEAIKDIQLKKNGTIKIKIDKLNLVTGEYWIDIAVRKTDMFAYDYCFKGCVFKVMSKYDEAGIAKLDHEWVI